MIFTCIEISMVWYANTFDTTSRPFFEDWTTTIILNQSDNPQFDVVIRSDKKAKFSISDIFVSKAINLSEYCPYMFNCFI